MGLVLHDACNYDNAHQCTCGTHNFLLMAPLLFSLTGMYWSAFCKHMMLSSPSITVVTTNGAHPAIKRQPILVVRMSNHPALGHWGETDHSGQNQWRPDGQQFLHHQNGHVPRPQNDGIYDIDYDIDENSYPINYSNTEILDSDVKHSTPFNAVLSRGVIKIFPIEGGNQFAQCTSLISHTAMPPIIKWIIGLRQIFKLGAGSFIWLKSYGPGPRCQCIVSEGRQLCMLNIFIHPHRLAHLSLRTE